MTTCTSPATVTRGFILATLMCLPVVGCGTGFNAEPVDLLIVGGRVMDPESGLDAVRNVAIRGGTIVTFNIHHLLS